VSDAAYLHCLQICSAGHNLGFIAYDIVYIWLERQC